MSWMPWRGLSWRRLAENGRKRAGWKLMYSSTPHFVRADPHNTRIFGLDKQNACPHNVFMSRSPSSIAVQSPIRTPCGSLPPGLSSKCPVRVQILFSLCPVSVQYLTSESEPPAMRLYEVDSFSSFRRRLRTPSRVLDTWKSKVGTREPKALLDTRSRGLYCSSR